MTKASAERITGYEIRLLTDSPLGVAYGAFRADVQIAAASGSKPGEALKLLVEKVYKIHSEIVFREQKWRCARCGQRRPLQAHHLVHRSKGRSDAVPNLIGECWACHEREHNR